VISQVRHWHPFTPGLEAAEASYQALGWPDARRLVLIRELREREQARGRKLFDCPGYTFHALVTSLDWPAEQVWRFYNSRAESESRIKEIAEHYGAKGFCVKIAVQPHRGESMRPTAFFGFIVFPDFVYNSLKRPMFPLKEHIHDEGRTALTDFHKS
jgi:hypothetical protein